MKIFLDLEANCVGNKKYLLQVGAVKVSKNHYEQYSKYCKITCPLTSHAKIIVGKSNNFFYRQKMSEKELYLDFLEFSKGCEVIAFGPDDKAILDNVCNRHGIDQKIEVIDFQSIFRKSIEDKNQDSLNSILAIFHKFNLHQHNAFCDAYSLKNAYESFYGNIEHIDEIKNNIKIERLRPRLLDIQKSRNKQIIKPNLNNGYGYVFLDIKVKENFDLEHSNRLHKFSVKCKYYSKNKILVDEYVFDKYYEDINEYWKDIDDFVINKIKPIFKNNIFVFSKNANKKAIINRYYKLFDKTQILFFHANYEAFKNYFHNNLIPTDDVLIMKAIDYFFNNQKNNFSKMVNYNTFIWEFIKK